MLQNYNNDTDPYYCDICGCILITDLYGQICEDCYHNAFDEEEEDE